LIGVIGIPGPIFNNTFTIIVNLNWPVTCGDDVAKELNIKSLTFLNDFVTNGYGITSNMIEGIDYEKMNDNVPHSQGPIAMIGAGTGLGYGYLIKTVNSKYYYVFPSEGGHQDFAPQNDKEWRYYGYLKNHYSVDRISVERACSGPSLPLIFLFHSEVEKMESEIFLTNEEKKKLTPEDVIKCGLGKQCRICEASLEFFIEIYGAAAGNMSLLILPTGGIYLLGGVSVALAEHIIQSETFRVTSLLIFS
jgi:glucokinase